MREKNLSTIVKQAGWSLSGKIISEVFRLINGILMAIMLGPFLLGLYQLGLRLQLFLLNFTKLGLDAGLTKYIPVIMKHDQKKVKALLLFVLRTGLLCSILFGVLLFLLSRYIAVDIFNKPDLVMVIKIFSFLLPLSTLNYLLMSANRGAKQLKYNVLYRYVLYSIFFSFILITIYYAKLGFHTLLVSIVVLEGIVAILLFLSLKKTFKFNVFLGDVLKKGDPQLGVTKKELFGFSTPLLFQGLIFYLMGTIDILMLGYFRSAESVGIYTVALKVALLVSFILYSFNDIFMPIISEKFAKGDFAEIRFLYQAITKWIFLVSLLQVGLIYVLHEDILLVFGQEYLPAAIPLLILSIGQLINASVGGVGILLQTMGHQKLVLVNACILLVLNVFLNYYLIERLGLNLIGAAIATSVSLVLVNIVRLIQLKLLRNLQPYNFSYLKVIIAFVPSYLITYGILDMIDGWFVWRILFGGTLLVSLNLIIYFLIGISDEDRFILKKIGDKITNG